jgi:ribosome-binding protein aMBF1 (putative translation factor)
MKKGPLSNKEKEFIDGNKSMSNEDIADKLERSVKVISRYVEVRAEEDSTHTSELFARKEDRGVTVMTEAASMAGDESKSNRKTKTPTRYQGVIHKIKED